MQEKNKIVEEALTQMRQLENVLAENAKGILASTMKEEINQLVKESLTEQEDEDEIEDLDSDVEDLEVDDDDMSVDSEVDFDMDDDNMGDMESDDDEDMEMDFDMDMDFDDEDTIDLRGASDEEILRVFKAMGEEDGIIVTKDGEDIHLKDENSNSEYLVKLGESEEEYDMMEEMDEESDPDVDAVIDAIFNSQKGMDMEEEEIMYEIEIEDEMTEMEEEMDEMEEEMDEMDDLDESYDPKKSPKGKSSIKPKGVGIGKGPKFSYGKTLPKKGFSDDKKEGPKTMGTGKAKFEFKEGEDSHMKKGDKSKTHKGEEDFTTKKGHVIKKKAFEKEETKEAARTLGNGSNFRKGGLPKPRAHSKVNNAIQKESHEIEIKMLREKNEEYRKALNVFREKLNEVAVFNSNLAYATRLFTEHSTTKKEKLNILRRFDEVETIKESKFLYKSIKDELNKSESKPISESMENKLQKTVSTGSSTTLIESKTYENPQYLRMRDLMSKLG
jgi:hypothetical protein